MRVLITGAAGMLARALHGELSRRGHEVVALDRHALDVTDPVAVATALRGLQPAAAIHCAAYTDVDGAEARETYARLINADSARFVADGCAEVGARFVYPSTDYVFDGSAARPYAPGDEPRPINAYGRSKLQGERAAAEVADSLIVRVAWLYGPERRGFVRDMIERARRLEAGAPGSLKVVTDQVGRPTSTAVAAAGIAALLEEPAAKGIHHVTGGGEPVSRLGLIREALRHAGLETVPVEPVMTSDFPAAAARPRYSVLDLAATEAITGALPDWRQSLAEAVASGRY